EVGGDHMSTNIDKNPRDVILSPVVSEKSYADMDEGRYTFLVDPRSNKSEIKLAIEKIFDVKVASVNTMNRQGKRQRSEEHTSELQSRFDLVCRLLLEKKT